MSDCEVIETKVMGFLALALANRWLRMTVVPHFGGKVMDLYDRRHEREWLWTNPYLTHVRPLSTTHPQEQFDYGGWDECFPAVKAGRFPMAPWADFAIHDHGNLWARDWAHEFSEKSPDRIVLHMHVTGENLPYTFERTITVAAGEPVVQFGYRVHNKSNVPMPFVWSSHPLLRVEAGMRIALPLGVRVWVSHTLPGGVLASGETYPWPAVPVRGRPQDLSVTLPQSEGWAAKLFVSNLGQGEVAPALEHPPSGRRLRFTFATREIPNIGLWLNYGGWATPGARPHYHLGFEPCIGGADDLEQAVERGEYGVLPPAGDRAWTLKVTLE